MSYQSTEAESNDTGTILPFALIVRTLRANLTLSWSAGVRATQLTPGKVMTMQYELISRSVASTWVARICGP